MGGACLVQACKKALLAKVSEPTIERRNLSVGFNRLMGRKNDPVDPHFSHYPRPHR
jgi:hypothetical protein